MKSALPIETAENRIKPEPAGISFQGIMIFAGIVALMIVAVLPASKLTLKHFEKKAQQRDHAQFVEGVSAPVARSSAYFPEPHEQPAPRVDLDKFLALEDAELNSYGWIDRPAGIVRIPIERAMELISHGRLPVFTNALATNVGPGILDLQQQRPAQFDLEERKK